MTTPQILSAALFERDDLVLAAHRKAGRAPFAGQWLLPMTPVRPSETAEDAVKRYAREQFGVEVSREAFVDTVYVEDPDDKLQYIANIFRADLTGGPMRFRADGDYDDARWLVASELAQLWMPPALRETLVRIITDPDFVADTDWASAAGAAAANNLSASGAIPLAERVDEAPTFEDASAPDNRAAWNAISKSYQEKFYGDHASDRLKWTTGVYEDEIQILDDVRGQHALVLGGGGGADCVALTNMGAVVVGIDISREQVEFAKKYAAKHGADNASFVEGSAEDLSRFDDASFDLVLAIHTLRYVAEARSALMEVARVLRPGGVLVISEPHPWNQIFSDTPPYRAERSYFSERTPFIDWNWDTEKCGDDGRLRDWRRTVSDWFGLLMDAGFTIERLVEPNQGDIEADDASGYDIERARLMPQVIIFKARKR